MKRAVFILALISFAAGVMILKSVLPVDNQVKDTVPVPLSTQTEDSLTNLNQKETIEKFFGFLNTGETDESLGILHSKIIPDEEAKENWLKQFSVLKSVSVKSIAQLNTDEEIYRVQLVIEEIIEDTSAAIPNFGWDKGENVRWITMEKEDNLWKISQIATGP